MSHGFNGFHGGGRPTTGPFSDPNLKTVKLGHHFEVQLGKMLQSEPISESDRMVPYLRSIHVQWTGVEVDDLPRMWASQRDLTRYRVLEGDLLVCEGGDVGRAAMVKKVRDIVVIQNAVHRVRSKRADVRFLLYVMSVIHSSGWLDVVCNKATIAHLTVEKLKELRLPAIDHCQQVAIADFLDRKTAAIDALIQKKEKLIELLEEKRAALINQAVTKGLDPNVHMKDSGIPWIGKIPAHWSLVSLRKHAALIQTGPFGSQLKADEYIDDGVPIVNPTNIDEGAIFPDWGKSVSPTVARRRLSRHQLFVNDIVMGRRGELGRCAVVQQHQQGWLCGTGSLMVRLNDTLKSDFAAIVLSARGTAEWLDLESVGSTMSNINSDIVGRIPIPSPPIEEQEQITDYLAKKNDQLRIARSKVKEQVAALQHYRQSLITNAVVGRIDPET